MLHRVIIACSILVSGLDCKSYSHYRKPECGEEIVSSSGMQLPSNEVCELKVKNKPGLSTALDIFWNAENVDREEICYGLEIFNEATKRYYDICEGATDSSFFVTGRGPFVLKLNELPAGVVVHVSYVTPKYTCGEKLNYELFGIPVEFHNNGEKDCFMSIPTGSLVRVENPAGNWKGECDVQLQVAQGPSVQQATTASHVHCLENEPLDFPVFCQAAILYMTSAIKTFVKVIVMSPTWSEAHRLFNYSRHCAHAQELLYDEHQL